MLGEQIMKDRQNVRAILFDDSSGSLRFLLLFAQKGYWQFPQGGIESGESEVEAVQREILEETGLRVWKRDVITKSRVEKFYFAERDKKPIKVNLSAYAVRVDSHKEVFIGRSGDAHQDFQWVSLPRAKKLLTKYPEQLEVFLKVCTRMKFN